MNEDLIHRIVKAMTMLNEEITADPQLGAAFRIGHSYFCPIGKDFSAKDGDWFSGVVRTEIAPMLHEYWYDNRAKANALIERILE